MYVQQKSLIRHSVWLYMEAARLASHLSRRSFGIETDGGDTGRLELLAQLAARRAERRLHACTEQVS
jgi:hypothetical protein